MPYREQQATCDAENPTTEAEADGFCQELPENVKVPCADGFSQADLSRLFTYGDEADVHDANATDKE